ncbi:sulfite:cytochrome C oxidoreductase subunit B [Sulfurimonas paralvinellae]|uniref:Sulfite:cytochrome C oxidoreductase subunit B n=1 Tax=Sulfurimonas paralvinellae TaxID=317658 RepID=A0A7M1B889_9BACT|nr:sulfite:cytochrome C oxidoreductase subunit B [Sulfurimonas paralvinellae]QOP45895.1 sulfite:cytochrome C oxidoreductase subunit B [Sulfurimonas paralvinellae]
MKKILLLLVLSVGSLFAQLKGDMEVPYISYEIKMGHGFDTVQANCLMCHSFGYILNQGPQSKEFWNKKIDKMIDEFKAPITKEDHKIIADYLFKHYGNGKLK